MNILFALVLVLFAAFSRLIPHAPNFTPVISIALFAGAYLQKRFAFLVPIAAMLVSDLVVGFYNPVSMAFVYGSLLLIVAIGLTMNNKLSVIKIGGFSLAGAALFFVLTNFGVWIVPNSIYPRTFTGLVECYVMAIPFIGNTIYSALIYSALMFGAYEAAHRFVFKTREIQQGSK
ncbi:MAG TPA: DUF6580 family putative transport protein [Candidatus Acidoferrales bacterium]|nr:DUF6580 family putative transport protein [Candidatus Acidoferrales bacterium]